MILADVLADYEKQLEVVENIVRGPFLVYSV